MLVALRLSIGWHFFQEGLNKYTDPSFTSAGFLMQATGPLAEHFHRSAGADLYGWNEYVGQPLAYRVPSKEKLDARIRWEKKRAADQDKAKKANQQPEIRIWSDAPYAEWCKQVFEAWRKISQEHIASFKLTDEQKAAVDQAFDLRRQQLVDYLEEHEEKIAEYRHELSRLAEMEQQAAEGRYPYRVERIDKMKTALRGRPGRWLGDVRQFEQNLRDDLHNLLNDQQRVQAPEATVVSQLQLIDKAVLYFDITVGALLLVGLFTRLASLGAGVFLLSVVATQPPWVDGAVSTDFQFVEMVAAFLLATTVVGRWGGLDYFIHRFLATCFGEREEE